ncbi:MAG: hypothetical protein Kow0069_03640 [Promethearchaeota archaeon]
MARGGLDGPGEVPHCGREFKRRGLATHVRAKHSGMAVTGAPAASDDGDAAKQPAKKATKQPVKKAANSPDLGPVPRVPSINEWERNFLSSVAARLAAGRLLTVKQERVLDRIERKSKAAREYVKRAKEAGRDAGSSVAKSNRDEHVDALGFVFGDGTEGPRRGGDAGELFGVGPVLVPDGWVFVPRSEHAVVEEVKNADRWWVTWDRVGSGFRAAGVLCPPEEAEAARERAQSQTLAEGPSPPQFEDALAAFERLAYYDPEESADETLARAEEEIRFAYDVKDYKEAVELKHEAKVAQNQEDTYWDLSELFEESLKYFEEVVAHEPMDDDVCGDCWIPLDGMGDRCSVCGRALCDRCLTTCTYCGARACNSCAPYRYPRCGSAVCALCSPDRILEQSCVECGTILCPKCQSGYSYCWECYQKTRGSRGRKRWY